MLSCYHLAVKKARSRSDIQGQHIMASSSELDLAAMNVLFTRHVSKRVSHFQLHGLGLVFAGTFLFRIGVGIANAACQTSCMMAGTQLSAGNLA
jgi:hypothetical protein